MMANQLAVEEVEVTLYPEMPLPTDFKFLISRNKNNEKQGGIQNQRKEMQLHNYLSISVSLVLIVCVQVGLFALTSISHRPFFGNGNIPFGKPPLFHYSGLY